MKPELMLSRRDFIATVSHLAVASAILPNSFMNRAANKDEFVLVNGWVLHRSDLA